MSESFTEIEYKFCLDTTNALMKNPLAFIFLKPVDPERDQCLDYFEIIRNPMDLGTVKSKLEGKKYKNSSEWRIDIMRIWDNSLKYNSKQPNLKALTEKIKKISIKMMSFIPKDQTDLWYIKVMDASKDLKKFLKLSPSSSIVSSRSKNSKHKYK